MLSFVKKSSEFRTVYDTGNKLYSPFFILFVKHKDTPGLQVGITVTKKLGNAVIRNRIKRRLRAMLRATGAMHSKSLQIVIIAKKSAFDADFIKMLTSFEYLIKKCDQATY